MKKSTNILLTGLTILGTIGTGVLAVLETPKAMMALEQDRRRHPYSPGNGPTFLQKVKLCWKFYIPAVSVCAATVAATVCSGVMNERARKSLAGSYILLEQAYKNYRSYVKDHYGIDADQKAIADTVAKTIPVKLEDEGGEEHLFFDDYSARYFHSSFEAVITAMYKTNRNFTLRGYSPLNEFYEMLDCKELPKIEIGDKVGWSFDAGACFYGYEWIDFEFEKTVTDDGLECYILSMPFEPTADYLE